MRLIRKISFFCLLIAAVLLGFSGCLDKASKQETLSVDQYFPDDNEVPAKPVWINVQPEVFFVRENQNGEQTRNFGVFLEWKKVTTNYKGDLKQNVMGYKIYRDNRKTAAAVIMDPEKTKYEDLDRKVLLDGTKHSYYVSAIDSKMRESVSDVQNAELKVGGVYPDAPRNFFILCNGDKVTLYWSPPGNREYCVTHGDQIRMYRICRSESGGLFQTVALVPAENQMFIDSMLKLNTAYKYQIFAITSIGNIGVGSELRDAQITNLSNEDLARPTAPTSLTLQRTEAGTPGAVKLTWKMPAWNDDGRSGTNMASDVVAYKIYRYQNQRFETSLGESQVYTLINVVYNTLEYIDNEIDITRKDLYYYYRVSAVDTKDHEGDLSYPVSYYLDVPTTATPAPEGFYIEVNAAGEPTFHWKLESGVETYRLWGSQNTTKFDVFREIDAKKELEGYKNGDLISYKISSMSLGDNEKINLKLQAYDNAYIFSSNLTYYVRIEKPGPFQNGRLVLYAGDLSGLFEARSIQQAWFVRKHYGLSQAAEDSLWGYDIRQGVHYRIDKIDGPNDSWLVLDAMGMQPPPLSNSATVLASTSITQEIKVGDFVYTDLSSTNTSELGLVDSVRPLFSVISGMALADSRETYYYLPAYNDDGLSFWRDSAGDGVDLHDFLYQDEEFALLQHGMEGDTLKLDTDVDPWTYYGQTWDILQVKANNPKYPDFWETLYNQNGVAPWDRCSRNLLNDWGTVKTKGGGCACYLGPDSKKKYIARDFYGETLASGQQLLVRWEGNYFGTWPAAAGTWPNSAHEIIFADKATQAANGITSENSLIRAVRKDNTLMWDLNNGDPIDYTSSGWSNDLAKNNYDMFQEEFRFKYFVPETGSYAVTMYFNSIPGIAGHYLIGLRKNGALIGTLQEVSDTTNKEQVTWPNVFASNKDRLDFYFYALGTQYQTATTNLFDGTFNFDVANKPYLATNSPCQLCLNRLEFRKLDSNI
ncbi:MAG: hypothetical protein PHW04_10560 [Candidatus Wallbacteria bacterium]|nr:hypothetical protein [Candidatus Wallbacteria bacterium]